MTARQRAKRIREMNARIAQIEAEKRRLIMALLPLETAESWSMGFRVVMRGAKLVAAMDARDEIRAARASA